MKDKKVFDKAYLACRVDISSNLEDITVTTVLLLRLHMPLSQAHKRIPEIVMKALMPQFPQSTVSGPSWTRTRISPLTSEFPGEREGPNNLMCGLPH